MKRDEYIMKRYEYVDARASAEYARTRPSFFSYISFLILSYTLLLQLLRAMSNMEVSGPQVLLPQHTDMDMDIDIDLGPFEEMHSFQSVSSRSGVASFYRLI